MKPEPHIERRMLPDRRSAPTSIWHSIILGGRRWYVRRLTERNQPHHVDHFHWRTLAWVLLLVVFTFVDGWLTLELLEAGCVEVNPVLHYSLGKGPEHFFLVKYLLTATGLPVLVLFGSRNRIGYLLPTFVLLYVVLIVYQLHLLHTLTATGGT